MDQLIKTNPFVIFKIPRCTNCAKLANLFDEVGLGSKYVMIDISQLEDIDDYDALTYLKDTTQATSFPMVFVNGSYVGGYKEVKQQIEFGSFNDILKKELNLSYSIDV